MDVNYKPPTPPLCKWLILPQAAHFLLASLQGLCLTPRGSRVLSRSLLILYAAMSLIVKPLTSRFCQSPPESRMDVFQHSPQQQEMRQNMFQEVLLKLELDSSTGSHGCSCRAAAMPHPNCHHATLQSVQCHRRSLSCHQPEMWIHVVRQLLDPKISENEIHTGDVAESQTIYYIKTTYIVAMGQNPAALVSKGFHKIVGTDANPYVHMCCLCCLNPHIFFGFLEAVVTPSG